MSVILPFPRIETPVTPTAPKARTVAGKLAAAIGHWRRRQENRAALRGLLSYADDRMLADVGMTRGQLADEAGRPFWQE